MNGSTPTFRPLSENGLYILFLPLECGTFKKSNTLIGKIHCMNAAYSGSVWAFLIAYSVLSSKEKLHGCVFHIQSFF